MKLNCPYCGSEVPAEHVNLDRLIAKCAGCNAVFSFEDQIDLPGMQPLKRLDVPLPKGIELANNGYDLTIIRRWFSLKYIFLTFFCLFWDGFLLFWYSMALSQRIWIMALFATGHAAVGVFLTYTTIAGYLNRTTITVSHTALAVSHGPLPWPGHKQLDSAGIRQMYCKEQIHRGKNSTTYTYEVHVALNTGKDEKLVTGLENSEQALYLEQEIERFLRIQDQPVRGELSR
jgi:hypothetical protein